MDRGIKQTARLDLELVRRGLAASRQSAQRLIMAGQVRVGSRPADKPDLKVSPESHIEVIAAGPQYASRGAYKLIAALDAFAVTVEGRLTLDVGASTGGFTDVLLRRGAKSVIALDVGYGQLAMRLRADPRVIVKDRCNIRLAREGDLPYRPDLITIDVSFISLALVMPALLRLAATPCDILALVKPQFEVGKGRVGRGGVVRDETLRQRAIEGVASGAQALGCIYRGLVAAPIKGPAGNQEYVTWFYWPGEAG